MGLFINKWSQRAGTGSREGFTKVRGLVPGDRDYAEKRQHQRKAGAESGTLCLSECWAMVPF